MSTFLKKPRNVYFSLSFLTLALLCTVILWYLPKQKAHALLGDPPVDGHTYARTLIHAGLDVDALAAAGLTTYDVDEVLSDAGQYMFSSNDDIEDLQGAVDQLNIQVATLRRSIRTGLASQDDVDAYANAVDSLATAQAALDAYLGQLFTAATSELTQAQQDCLASIRSNAERRSVYNLEFLTVERSDAEWVELRDALANERISYANNELPDAYAQIALTSARANVNVSTAASNHTAYITNVEYAWEGAVYE